jgi:hypothetical protein
VSDAEPLELRDERARQAHDLLVERLRALTTNDQWLEMLETSRRFHTYSARNVLLLLAQGAQGHVAGYRTWQTIPAQGGGTCQVRKGAHAMTVLAPITRERDEIDPTTGKPASRRVLVAFKAVRVFDETALVAPPAIPHVVPELLQGDGPRHVWDALTRQVQAAGFTLDDADCAPANGRTDWSTRTVTVRPDLDHAQRTKTLAHEVAHIHLHDPDGDLARRSPRERMEVEAESVAYLVCAHAGIDSAQYTIPYVAHWSGGNIELVQDTAERVITTARVITDGLDRALEPTPIPDRDARERALPAASTARADHDHVHAERVSPLRAHGCEDESLASVRARVERDAARLLAQLAANPDAWGADPQTRDALRRAVRAATPPATPAVAAARQRLGDLLHHPSAAPEPPDLGPIPDLQ